MDAKKGTGQFFFFFKQLKLSWFSNILSQKQIVVPLPTCAVP